MGHRVCDPFDAAAIVGRIATGETTTADAYRSYAASAARPCARTTFAQKLSRVRVSAGLSIAVKRESILKRAVSGHEIRKRAEAAPVLVIGPDAALRVRGGALHVEHGSGKDRVHVRIDVDDPPRREKFRERHAPGRIEHACSARLDERNVEKRVRNERRRQECPGGLQRELRAMTLNVRWFSPAQPNGTPPRISNGEIEAMEARAFHMTASTP
jgi:hypothetical protein